MIVRRSQIILEDVAKKHRVRIAEILGRSRVAYIVAARREAILRMRAAGMKQGIIAGVMQRERTTIIEYTNSKRAAAKKIYHAANWRRWRDARAAA